ncbi:MAG: tRNA pseudouridine(55) synthase TruB [Clostridia bacterium]|nr:tRNA pseudouridine(55) synthase TruB [Clostridia bacterium]
MDGLVSVLKPPGMSSSDAVVDVRRLLGIKKVGHTGTLDPGAAGVLVICFGRAVRLFDYLVDKRKRYIFEICFGAETDTQDVFGKVTARSDCEISAEMLLSVLNEFSGAQKQLAPMYSALKSGGRKLYDIALAGGEAPDKVRDIEVFDLRLLEVMGYNRFLLSLECSRGAYVRTLCHDIGRRLGACAHLSFLLRTASGEYGIEEAHSIAELEQLKAGGRLNEAIISCEQALSFLPRADIGANRAEAMKNGLSTYVAGACDGKYRCYCGGEFLGTARVRAEQLKLEVHLY